MTTFPPAFLDELRARLPLSEIIGRRVRLVRAGREFKGCCPFHNEKTPSFYINDDKQFFHCFGCGAHGDVIGYTMRADHLAFPEAIEALASQAGLTVPRDSFESREKYDADKRLLQLLDRATAWFEEQLRLPHGRDALRYLESRGLSDEAARRYRLGYAPNDGQALIRKLKSEGFREDDMLAVGLAKKSEERNELFSFFRNRVMFPVGDRRGQTVAFGGRVLGDGEPKYLNSPDHPLFHKGKLLYGLSRARTAHGLGQPVIVVEGYMDVIALVEAGYIGAVAPLGTAMTEDQLAAVWKLAPPLDTRTAGRDYSPVLCFDGDNAGQRAASRAVERAIPLLTVANSVRVAFLPTGEDPDSLIRTSGKAAMQGVLDSAKPMIDFLWETTREGRRLATPEDRGGFIAALRQKTARIADETLRALYKDEVQKRLASAFQWTGGEESSWTPPQTQTKSNWNKNRGSNNRFAPARTTQPLRVTISATDMRERALIALMVNNPGLFHEFGEDFAILAFHNPEMERLKGRIVELLSSDSHESLDANGLYRQLCESDGSCPQALANALSETTYTHAAFARPGKSDNQARLGWKSIWNKHLQESLQSDLERASQTYAADATDENWARLMALRSQLEEMTKIIAEQETQGDESAFA